MLDNANSPFDVKFPKQREELLAILEADQNEIRGNFHAFSKIKSKKIRESKYDQVAKNCNARARRMLEILDEIKDPTADNIGMDGSSAIPVIALHSTLAVMKDILKIYELNYQKDDSNIYKQGIPPLKDRVLLLEGDKQLFGSQWMVGEDGKPFLLPVKDFPDMNRRRLEYGLEPLRRPRDLAIGAVEYPLGKGLAKESDQRQPTEKEFADYTRGKI